MNESPPNHNSMGNELALKMLETLVELNQQMAANRQVVIETSKLINDLGEVMSEVFGELSLFSRAMEIMKDNTREGSKANFNEFAKAYWIALDEADDEDGDDDVPADGSGPPEPVIARRF
jgi:hypothetical protein